VLPQEGDIAKEAKLDQHFICILISGQRPAATAGAAAGLGLASAAAPAASVVCVATAAATNAAAVATDAPAASVVGVVATNAVAVGGDHGSIELRGMGNDVVEVVGLRALTFFGFCRHRYHRFELRGGEEALGNADVGLQNVGKRKDCRG
jgi:hypothetical protein